MKAARWNGVQKITVDDLAVPEPAESELILKVESCGVCGSDLRTYFHGSDRIQTPKVLGHEIAGTVVATGKNARFKMGDRIAVGSDIPCGKCRYCKTGAPNNCKTNLAIGYQFEGGFAEYFRVPALALDGGPVQKFSGNISFEEAAMAEPLACCINGFEIALMKPGKTVGIWGVGPIGMMLADLAVLYGAEKVLIIDTDANRLKMAKALRPNLVAIDADDFTEKRIMDQTDGIGLEIIFTANSSIASHQQVLKVIAKRGVINFFGGLPKAAEPITVSSNWLHYNEIYLTGSHGSTPKQHEAAIRLIETGKIVVKDFITDRFKLQDIQNAFETAISRVGLKVMVNPGAQ